MVQKQNAQQSNNKVHYLCHIKKGVLVYPHQTESNYNAYGSFYLLGDSMESSYSFSAFDDGDLIELTLIRDESNPNFFVAKHERLGDFLFHCENVIHWNLEVKNSGLKAIKRLRPWNEKKLESVCSQSNFYFVGFADIPDDEKVEE
jgi:hypothetical protein